MSVVSRIKSYLAGSNVPPASWPIGWWQSGQVIPTSSTNGSVIEACIGAYAQTVAQLPGRHYRVDENNVKEYVPNSALSQALHQPNDYQTISDFFLNLVYQLYLHGNAYIVVSEDKTKMFLLDPKQTNVHRVEGSADVFYSTGGLFADAMSPDAGQVMIPERYVGHLRLHTPHDPLIGITPIKAAAASVAANGAITGHQASFFTNMNRPSGVISTDLNLSARQMAELRDAWDEQSKGLNAGGVPILGYGMKWSTMSLSNQDAEMIAALKFTVEDISRVFRVPLMMINSMDNATFDNAETLMRFWLSSGLGFLVNSVEQTIAKLYGLPRNQGVELDTEVLLRSDFRGRMEAMGTAVTKGIYSPNEARKREGMVAVDGGDMPRVQQQMVPLDWEAPEAAPEAVPMQEPAPDEDDEPIDEKFLLAVTASHMEGMTYATQ